LKPDAGGAEVSSEFKRIGISKLTAPGMIVF